MSIGHGAFVRSHNVKPATPVVRMDLCRPEPKPPTPVRRDVIDIESVDLTPLPGSARALAKSVAEANGVPFAEVLSKRRTADIVRARHEAIKRVALAFPNLSSTQLGQIFQKNHTTILHTLGRTSRAKKGAA